MKINLKPIYILFLFTVILFTACKKKTKCDNAQLCIKNIGTDTIYFCWGCSSYTDSILPGGKACRYVGPIEVSGSSENVVWSDFESTHGNFRIKVDDCLVEKDIE
jgi:hypothetical protein